MSDETCNLRLQALEMTQQTHEERFTTHDGLLQEQGDTLNSIERGLFQIKWMAAGALFYVTIKEIGLLQTVKAVIGL